MTEARLITEKGTSEKALCDTRRALESGRFCCEGVEDQEFINSLRSKPADKGRVGIYYPRSVHSVIATALHCFYRAEITGHERGDE
jgi:hypothetical protein